MTSYTNLDQSQIDTTTSFFNKLDTNLSGIVSIQQIIDACYNDAASKVQLQIPQWLVNISLEYTPESIITQQEYDAKKEYNTIPIPGQVQTLSYPELTLDFSDIDTDNDGQITFQQLYDKYTNLVPTPQLFYTSQSFIDLIKTEYNLTNESTITLEQFLTYENDHNITRYWPI